MRLFCAITGKKAAVDALGDTCRHSAWHLDELAGLACEAGSVAVDRHADGAWEVRHGPFAGDRFATLPGVALDPAGSDVDKYLPDVARLMEGFDFVPTWRIDDIMISYATDQGGVGPHTDAYDVFLMRAGGRRRWRLSYQSTPTTT